jgi:hypothetical protein
MDRKHDATNLAERSFRQMIDTTDAVCAEFADRGVQITVRRLPEDSTYVLIEGDQTAFEFLGKLFLAHARGEDCGFQISPNSAGCALFSQAAQFGIYLHRLPCVEVKP